MKDTDRIWLEFNSNLDLKLFLVEPGNEIFIPLFLWPSNQDPKLLPIRKNDNVIDVRIQRTYCIKNSPGCLDADAYSGAYYYPNVNTSTIILLQRVYNSNR